jgi:hypothetical protein
VCVLHTACSDELKYVITSVYLCYLTTSVAQLVEALRNNPEGRGFDSRWSHWNFSVTKYFRSHCGPGVDSASDRNEYQESFLVVKTAGA